MLFKSFKNYNYECITLLIIIINGAINFMIFVIATKS